MKEKTDYFQSKSGGTILNYNQMIEDAKVNHPEIDSPLNVLDLTDFYDKIEEEQGRSLQYGYLGNGITVYDSSRTDPETHDYPIVAHISDEGIAKFYTDYLTDTDKNGILEEAAKQHDRYKAIWDKEPIEDRYEAILSRSNTAQLIQITKDPLPLADKVAKYEKSVIFGQESFPVENNEPTKKTTNPSGGASGDSDNTEMTGDRMDGHEREFIVEKEDPNKEKEKEKTNPFDITKETHRIDDEEYDLSYKRNSTKEQSEELKPKKKRDDYER